MKESKPTKYGVVYDIDNSPYESMRSGLLFRFSSLKHKEKFDENARIKEEWLNDSLSRRFHITVDLKTLADIQLYQQVETRGFYIYNIENEEEYKCPEVVILHGLKIHLKDLSEQ